MENRDKISFVRRCILTPSGPVYNIKEPEMSNRLLREFSRESEFMMRASFLDDNLDYARNMRFITDKLFRRYLDCVQIFDMKYIVLGWSASQLRASSCWLYAETPDLRTKDHIIRDLGNFDKITIPAKKAARIGQSFSQSIPIPT